MKEEAVLEQPSAVSVPVALTADRDFWPTVMEALSEVKDLLARDPAAFVQGEDGVVSATLVASLLKDAVRRDPGSKLRPLGWNRWPTK